LEEKFAPLPFRAENLIANGGDKDAHQRANDVEEAIGQVGKGRGVEDSGLCHAATIPRNQYRGYGNTIFDGTTQQATFIIVVLVDVLEDATRKHDADVLVGGSDVEEQSRCYGRRYQTDAPTDETDKHIGDAL
jgi:hypothetical protein